MCARLHRLVQKWQEGGGVALTHYPKLVILFAVFLYLRYPVFYRDLEKVMEERDVDVDHATLNRWVVK